MTLSSFLMASVCCPGMVPSLLGGRGGPGAPGAGGDGARGRLARVAYKSS